MKKLNTIQKSVILVLLFLWVLYLTTYYFDSAEINKLENYMLPLIVTSIVTFIIFDSKK